MILGFNFQHVIRKELQLPPLNISTVGDPLYKNAGVSSAIENKGSHIQEDSCSSMVEGQVRLPSVERACDVAGVGEVVATLATEKRSQLPQAGSSDSLLAQLRDVQKRLLEFIRKRVSTITSRKSTHVEYQKESIIAEQKEFESINEETEQEARDARVPSPLNQPQAKIDPEEVSTYALDNESNRLELARLYNEMCKVINENEQESFQIYTRNKSAGLCLRRNLCPFDSLCEGVWKILKVLQASVDFNVGLNQSSMQSEDHINGEDADVQSDSHEDDLGAGDEVNSDSKQHLANSKASPKITGNSGVGIFSSMTAIASTLRGFQSGEACCNTNSADILRSYPKVGANIEVMEGKEDRSGCFPTTPRAIVLDD